MQVRERLSDIKRVELTTQESALRIISKEGRLANCADRDHCLQYMVSVVLAFGDLHAENYSDSFHERHEILDELRSTMIVQEDTRYSIDYHEPAKRSIANAVQVFFKDGSCTKKVEVDYPLGHRRRREEGLPVLISKFKKNVATRFDEERCSEIFALFEDRATLQAMPVDEFMQVFVV